MARDWNMLLPRESTATELLQTFMRAWNPYGRPEDPSGVRTRNLLMADTVKRGAAEALGLLPGAGEALAVQDSVSAGSQMADALQRGNIRDGLAHGAASLAAGLGAIPLIGAIARGGRGLGKATTAVPSAAGKKADAASEALPMDQAARMQRARDMGFSVQMPLYHGTAADFREFDLSLGGHTKKAAPARMGVWLAEDPQVAAEFSEMAASKGPNSPPRTPGTAGHHAGPSIYPLLHRPGNAASLTLTGDETDLQMAATIDVLWEEGYDAIRIKNYTSPSGEKGKTIFIVKDPAQLRSLFAAFDPAKINSRDILAGIGGAGTVGFVLDDDTAGED